MLFMGSSMIEITVGMSKLVGSADVLKLMYIHVCAHMYLMIPNYNLQLAASIALI